LLYKATTNYVHHYIHRKMSDIIIGLKDVHFVQCKISKARILSTKMQKTQTLTLKCSLRVTMAEWEAIFKSGQRNDVSNYRDIAILSTVGKLFELLVYRYMYEDLKGLLRAWICYKVWHNEWYKKA
jgi:hypothetical protein